MLVQGKWTADWQPIQKQDDEGRFQRQPSSVRNWVTPDGRSGPTGDGGFPAETGRYHLYVALICPWACRTLMVRSLLGLEEVITVSVVSPVMSNQGWQFGGFRRATEDHLYGATRLHELYTRHNPAYSGRATVPVLWDKKNGCMVNNESADIIRMFNSSFSAFSNRSIDLYPPALRKEIDHLNAYYYENLNNGVYRAGFATSQQAYEEAYDHVFAALDHLEESLAETGPYLFGSQLTETDIRLFVTLIRFDAAYHGLFKCNRQRIVDYPHTTQYMKHLYALPGIRETVDLDHIKTGYYSISSLNPNGIVPKGPELDLVN